MKKVIAVLLTALTASAPAQSSPYCYLYDGIERETCERQDALEQRLDDLKRQQEEQMRRQEQEAERMESEAAALRDRIRKCEDPLQPPCGRW